MLCASEDGERSGICQACLNDLPWHNSPHCIQCGSPSNAPICGHCLDARPHFDVTYALFRYEFPVSSLLQHYKYKNMLHLTNTFAELWYEKNLACQNSIILPSHGLKKRIDLIIPMPMHEARLKERGFNQALEIARLLAKKMQLTLDYTTCKRIKLTPPQASLPLKERLKNIRGVFGCSRNLQGLHIAIVDDVMTTGTSLNELASMLKKSGAAYVECWVIARTLPK